MLDEQTFCLNLELAETVRDVAGSIVECGVWRGGMIAGLCALLGPERNYVLFDSFEGLPLAQEIDGAAAQAWQADINGDSYHDNCAATQDFAHRAMEIAGVQHYVIKPGWFEQTIPEFQVEETIALLRIDADWYESTATCLDHLFDKVVPSGLIIIDDYYAWDGCSRAVHDFLSKRSSAVRIRSHADSVCYLRIG